MNTILGHENLNFLFNINVANAVGINKLILDKKNIIKI